MLSELSLIALQGDFLFNVIASLVAGVLLTGLGWIAVVMIRGTQFLFRASRAYYRINGIWIGPCTLPRHSGEVEGIEIYHLKWARCLKESTRNTFSRPV